MNTLVCRGLDGANPLHFMASLGILRLLALKDDRAKIRWEWNDGWRPEYCWDHGKDGDVVEFAAAYLGCWLRELGKVGNTDPSLDRQIRELSAELKKLRKAHEESRKKARAEIKERKLKGEEAERLEANASLHYEQIISQKQSTLDLLQGKRNDMLGTGIAHLGDIIGVPTQMFRSKANAAVEAWFGPRNNVNPCRDHPQLVAEVLAALASDAISENGKVQPTPYSFSNGSSGQCLLKDFRGCCAECFNEAVQGILTGEAVMSNNITGLNWNPADQRSYALQWQDPSGGVADDPVANALAFVGMSLLPAIPTASGLSAVGWAPDRNKSGFVWPLWDEAIFLDEVRGLLSISPNLVARTSELGQQGIHAMYVSNRINPTGKRNFFSPSKSV